MIESARFEKGYTVNEDGDGVDIRQTLGFYRVLFNFLEEEEEEEEEKKRKGAILYSCILMRSQKLN